MFESSAEVPPSQPSIQHLFNNLGAPCMLSFHSAYKRFENLPAFQKCMISVIERIDSAEITTEFFHTPINLNTIKPPRCA